MPDQHIFCGTSPLFPLSKGIEAQNEVRFPTHSGTVSATLELCAPQSRMFPVRRIWVRFATLTGEASCGLPQDSLIKAA